jgi:hypothetical protein
MTKRLLNVTIICVAALVLLTVTVSLGRAQQGFTEQNNKLEVANELASFDNLTQLLVQNTTALDGVFLGDLSNDKPYSAMSEQDENEVQFNPAGTLLRYFPLQGHLTDSSGNPLNGDYHITFRLYLVASGGTEICHDTNVVSVVNGLFSTEILGNCLDSFNGQQIYLGIEVEDDGEMSPRQPIYATPYALSLRPGAVITSSLGAQAILHIESWSTTGRGLRAYAMATSGVNYGVVGASRSPDGFGGYFYNTDPGGYGLKGEGAIGVYGESEDGSGVYGFSTNHIGLYGVTNAADNNYGLYTPDNLYSHNIHMPGAQMQVVQNGGQTSLETGDVVVFSGIGEPLEAGGQPVIQVVGVDSANSTAVAGVVYSRYNIETLNAEPEEAILDYTPEGKVAPGEYLLMVVQGPAQVKASALTGAIQPGDLLSSASQVGYAAKATKVTLDGVETALPGTILGKALESLAEGKALIYIFITLQ